MTGIAFIGCGFVADYYIRTLQLHHRLELVGAFDRDPKRLGQWCQYHDVHPYGSLQELLRDNRVEVVVNLTNPHSHYEISSAALAAGKHVYSEKPLATRLDDAINLVGQAKAENLKLSSAPCNLFSETAQTMWKALREKIIGKVYLACAELDDGLIHRAPYQQWVSESGAPWPARDEFEVGCTMEHAGYYLGWLVAFFGPIKSLTSFGTVCVTEKGTTESLTRTAPDFTCACIEFTSGMVARLTCSIVSEHDHRLQIVGDNGILACDDCWFFRSPVTLQRRFTIRRRMMLSPFKKRLPLVGNRSPHFDYRGTQQMDFCAGVADLAEAIEHESSCYLESDFCLHVNEAVIAISDSMFHRGEYRMTTTCQPMVPLAQHREMRTARELVV